MLVKLFEHVKNNFELMICQKFSHDRNGDLGGALIRKVKFARRDTVKRHAVQIIFGGIKAGFVERLNQLAFRVNVNTRNKFARQAL